MSHCCKSSACYTLEEKRSHSYFFHPGIVFDLRSVDWPNLCASASSAMSVADQCGFGQGTCISQDKRCRLHSMRILSTQTFKMLVLHRGFGRISKYRAGEVPRCEER